MRRSASQENADIWIDASRVRVFDDASDGRLGAGSFGSVYRGTLDGSDVAIKQMNHGSNEERSQFEREIRRYKYLRSPHIVQFLGLSHRPGYPAGWLLLQDLMEGGSVYDSLRELVCETQKRGPTARRCLLDPRDLVRTAWHIALGVRYLHQERLTHGDIKPQNILLTERMSGIRPNGDGFFSPTVRVKLTDFGLSRSYNEAVQTVAAGRLDDIYGPVGTFAYLAPEAIPGISGFESARAADIYSLGVLFYEMASCSRPWEGFSIPQISKAVTVDAARPIWKGDETLPQEFRSLIADCWDQVPSNRPSAAQISSRLEQIYRCMGPKQPSPEPETIEILSTPRLESSSPSAPALSPSQLSKPGSGVNTSNGDGNQSSVSATPVNSTADQVTLSQSAFTSDVDFNSQYPSPKALSTLSSDCSVLNDRTGCSAVVADPEASDAPFESDAPPVWTPDVSVERNSVTASASNEEIEGDAWVPLSSSGPELHNLLHHCGPRAPPLVSKKSVGNGPTRSSEKSASDTGPRNSGSNGPFRSKTPSVPHTDRGSGNSGSSDAFMSDEKVSGERASTPKEQGSESREEQVANRSGLSFQPTGIGGDDFLEEDLANLQISDFIRTLPTRKRPT